MGKRRVMVAAALAMGVLAAGMWARGAAPGGQPATQPHPRDKLPFTNTSLTKLDPKLPTLFIAGDSTAATGPLTARDGNPIRGWAAVLVDYFDTSKVNLCNYAIGGARFNSYLAPGRGGGASPWDQLLGAVKAGDFVVIQFGQNSGPLPGIGDDVQEVAGRGGGPGTTLHTHGWYLRKMIRDVKAKGATPIAMTLTVRDVWTNGKVERLKEQKPGEGGMSDWTREVAAQEHVAVIDESNIAGDMYDKLGQTEADKLFADHHLHTTTAGAIINCEAFISGLKAIPDMPLVADLNAKGKAIPAYVPAGK
ncbi:MAG TPA: GDSL-type esterase/lipase family protein [Phycisphaerae bacterium]|nr:GDSL-type esterase/lipase family protein [Phycisphaerae bacterium]